MGVAFDSSRELSFPVVDFGRFALMQDVAARDIITEVSLNLILDISQPLRVCIGFVVPTNIEPYIVDRMIFVPLVSKG